MSRSIILAASLALALPAVAGAAPVAATTVPADSEKLALATTVAGALWPDGTYGRMIESFAGGNGLMDVILDLRPSEIMGAVAEGMAGKDVPKPAKDAKPGRTLREEMVADDPHFDERTRITAKIVGEEMTRIAKPLEPKMRVGLAKSIARRFTREQLVPIAAFFQTDAGKAYAAQSIGLYFDKDVLLAMIQSMPAMIKEMPGVMTKIEKATAHLPKPKKPTPDEGDQGEKDELPST